MRSLYKFFLQYLFAGLCFLYVGMLLHYSLAMWESRQRYAILFLGLTLLLAGIQNLIKNNTVIDNRKKEKGALVSISKHILETLLSWTIVFLAIVGTYYFWTEYQSLSWERAGAINNTDFWVGFLMILCVVYVTWSTSGPVIPIVAIIFSGYSLFGHLIPGFFHHPPISLTRFVSINAADIDGIYGSLTKLGATWIAIFAFLAGMIEGFGGLNYILRLCNQVFSKNTVAIPQIAVVSSMIFGGFSGSAAANAAGTGAFTIPLMKKFGLPAEKAAAVETIASSGGQIMPPILGSAAFVMCDYLNVYYKDVLLASVFSAFLFTFSVMLGVYFISKRHIDPNVQVDLPEEFQTKMSFMEILRGVPIFLAMTGLLIVFIVFKLNILLGGFIAIIVYLFFQLIYEIFAVKGNWRFIINYFDGLYRGTIAGSKLMITLGAMLATLGIVVRVLITTGLSEKISYAMVSNFGDTFFLFLILTMLVCILFGMAVSTVAAYIMVVTLAAPALIKLGLDPMVAHFAVFYWAMLSAFTPPVAGVAVIAAGIAKANFLKTSWESIKLGFPLMVLPFFFIRYPEILSFSFEGLVAFGLALVGFSAISCALQSGWGKTPQTIIMLAGIVCLLDSGVIFNLLATLITLCLLIYFWKKNSFRHVCISSG